MPNTLVGHEYELHMPMLANPRAYYRFPNATEAYRSHRLAVSHQSTVLSSAVSSQSDGAHAERVLTDDSGLQLTGSSIVYNGGETTVELTADNLKVHPSQPPPPHTCPAAPSCTRHVRSGLYRGGTLETCKDDRSRLQCRVLWLHS